MGFEDGAALFGRGHGQQQRYGFGRIENAVIAHLVAALPHELGMAVSKHARLAGLGIKLQHFLGQFAGVLAQLLFLAVRREASGQFQHGLFVHGLAREVEHGRAMAAPAHGVFSQARHDVVAGNTSHVVQQLRSRQVLNDVVASGVVAGRSQGGELEHGSSVVGLSCLATRSPCACSQFGSGPHQGDAGGAVRQALHPKHRHYRALRRSSPPTRWIGDRTWRANALRFNRAAIR